MPQQHAHRRRNLLKIMQERNLDAFLVTDDVNVSYLTGFTGDSSYLLLQPENPIVISDFRYTTQLEEECPDLDRTIRGSKTPLLDLTGSTVQTAGVRKVGIESNSLPVDTLNSLSKHVHGVEWVGCPAVIDAQLRSIKDDLEIAEIRQALEYAQQGFRNLLTMLTPQMTEFEASYELEHAMRKLGARGHAFPAIVARDDRAAMPHYSPAKIPLDGGTLLLIDWGAETLLRYRCDLTRTLVIGEPNDRLETIYGIVLEAQQLAIKAIGPGQSCREIDEISRKFISDNGFGDYFDHGLGHGFGLRIHEQPRFSPISEDVLVPGMVVTVEPGIYLPGWGGVRIEDNVLVTNDGHEVLSSLPSSFESAQIRLGLRD